MKWNPEEIEKETHVQKDISINEKPKKKEKTATARPFKSVEKGVAKGY